MGLIKVRKHNRALKFLILSFLYLSHNSVFAGLDFDQVTQSDVDGLGRDFSALMSHTTVSPASGLLVAKKFEFGLLYGRVTLPNMQETLSRTDPEGATSQMLNVGLLGLYSIHKKLTLEAKYIPDMNIGDIRIGSQSLALKKSSADKTEGKYISAWRAEITNSSLGSDQTLNNATTGNQPVNIRNQLSSLSIGAAWLLEYNFTLLETWSVEPYVGFGLLHAETRFNADAPSGISVFTNGASTMRSSQTGAMLISGLQVHSFFTKIGFEFSRVFDSNKISFKLSFGY